MYLIAKKFPSILLLLLNIFYDLNPLKMAKKGYNVRHRQIDAFLPHEVFIYS